MWPLTFVGRVGKFTNRRKTEDRPCAGGGESKGRQGHCEIYPGTAVSDLAPKSRESETKTSQHGGGNVDDAGSIDAVPAIGVGKNSLERG